MLHASQSSLRISYNFELVDDALKEAFPSLYDPVGAGEGIGPRVVRGAAPWVPPTYL
jgi:hypothetical protein